jgi:hypothetical protein
LALQLELELLPPLLRPENLQLLISFGVGARQVGGRDPEFPVQGALFLQLRPLQAALILALLIEPDLELPSFRWV